MPICIAYSVCELSPNLVSRKFQVQDVKNVIIWGNHSSTQFPDVAHAKVTKNGTEHDAYEVINDMEWIQGPFISVRLFRFPSYFCNQMFTFLTCQFLVIKKSLVNKRSISSLCRLFKNVVRKLSRRESYHQQCRQQKQLVIISVTGIMEQNRYNLFFVS